MPASWQNGSSPANHVHHYNCIVLYYIVNCCVLLYCIACCMYTSMYDARTFSSICFVLLQCDAAFASFSCNVMCAVLHDVCSSIMLVLVCALMLLHTYHSAVFLCDFYVICVCSLCLLSGSRGGTCLVFLNICVACQQLWSCHSACHNLSVAAFQRQLQRNFTVKYATLPIIDCNSCRSG